MRYINNQDNTGEVKKFVNGFFFPDPNWENLPKGFPHLKKDGLSKEEKHLLSGIVLAWMATRKDGQNTLIENCIKTGVLALIVFTFLFFGKDFSESPEWKYVKEVSAATVSATLKTARVTSDAEEINLIFESTISGVLKQK